jgi:hypothetical protein
MPKSPKSRSKRTSAREYVKEPPSHIVRIIERMDEALSEASDEPRRGLIDVAVRISDDAAEPRLPVLARNQLRRELRKHPEAKRHVAGLKDTIDQLSKPELLTLAKRFGIDVQAIIERSMARGKGMASVLEPEELEKWEHTLKYPAFVGLLEFDISFTILGKRVKRKAKAEFKFTPGWPYFDLQKKELFVGWPGSIMTLHVLTVPHPDDADAEEPHWVRMEDLAEADILPDGVWDRIRDVIEDKCKAENAKRRRAAGLKAKPRA